MARTRIGGVTVARGGTVRWGMLFSIIMGGGVYAYFEGAIGLVVGFREFLLRDVLGGVRSFVVTLIDLEFTVAQVAIKTAWWEFWSDVRETGPLAYVVAVLAVGSLLLMLFVLL